MKLLRVGPAGAEAPALLDGDGILRDLSGVVPDIDGALLADGQYLNIDPYFEGRSQGRVRHLFVSAPHRGAGLGRMLVETVIDRARQYFSVLNTRAPQGAFGFYERLGFRRVAGEEFVTHRLVFGKGN